VTGVQNLRIHFYGVQGSGSTFPPKAEREASQEIMDLDLLERVLADLQRRANGDGRLDLSVEELIGGPLDRRTLKHYRSRFDVPEPRVYGGWTTCMRVETACGHDIVFDCGSGFRICAQDVMKKWGTRDEGRDLYIFGSHSHFDHTEGFEQAAICFDPRNHIHVASNRQYLAALDMNLGIFSKHVDVKLKGVQTPLHYELMPANFHSCEIRDLEAQPPTDDDAELVNRYHHIDEPIRIGDTTIRTLEVFHPSPCYAYRVERGGKAFVFCTDHELRHGDDPDHPLQKASLEAEARLREFAAGADVLYRDGQYQRIEYDGHQGIGSPFGVPRIDWGHSCIEDVIEMADECGIRRTYVGHHDPNRDWSERNWIDEILSRKGQQSGRFFELARAETVIDL
jgi:phosphoribosyl 1,2-cyclic phosphodiesterase